MTSEWTIGTYSLILIGYIVVWMVPVLLLAVIIAYVLERVKDFRTQVAILFSLGVIAFLFSLGVIFSPQGSLSSYLLFSPLSLFWALAIVLPLVILWHYSPEKPSSMDVVICTFAVSAIILVLAIVLLIVAFITQSVLIDPLLFLQFVLPTPGLVLYIYPPELVWFLRFCIVLGLAALSYLLLRSYRTFRQKRSESSPP
jgi:hypothetical protein